MLVIFKRHRASLRRNGLVTPANDVEPEDEVRRDSDSDAEQEVIILPVLTKKAVRATPNYEMKRKINFNESSLFHADEDDDIFSF